MFTGSPSSFACVYWGSWGIVQQNSFVLLAASYDHSYLLKAHCLYNHNPNPALAGQAVQVCDATKVQLIFLSRAHKNKYQISLY